MDELCHWIEKPFMAGTDCAGAAVGIVTLIAAGFLCVLLMYGTYIAIFGGKNYEPKPVGREKPK